MKAVLLNRKTALIVLIVVAVISVPLLGGLKLKSAYAGAFSEFEAAGKQFDKYGNSLVTDMDYCVNSADDVLSVARAILGEDDEEIAAAKEAIAAYREARKSDPVKDDYKAFRLVIPMIRPVYRRTKDNDGVLTYYSTIVDRLSIITHGGCDEIYRSAERRASDLISGFPASLLAKLYGLG